MSGDLQLFVPPDGAGPEFVRDIFDAMLSCTDVQPTFRKHPAFLGGMTNVAWAVDKDVELDYHLRRSALPTPGRVRDLLELTSRLHGSLLDRHRPLWETHLVEGLDDGRYALYCKMHHSLIDGVSAQRLMMRALTNDPEDDELRVPWQLKPRRRTGRRSHFVDAADADPTRRDRLRLLVRRRCRWPAQHWSPNS